MVREEELTILGEYPPAPLRGGLNYNYYSS